jgi:hypothetical protein
VRLAPLALGVLISVPSGLTAQTWAPVAVATCMRADSLLGAPSGTGRVQGIYDAKRDTIYLLAGSPRPAKTTELSGNLALHHGESVDSPALQFNLMLRGPDAAKAFSADDSPPLTLILSDTGLISFGMLERRRYESGIKASSVPISFRLAPRSYLSLIQAGKAEMHVGDFVYAMTPTQQRDFTALYRVAICGTRVAVSTRHAAVRR